MSFSLMKSFLVSTPHMMPQILKDSHQLLLGGFKVLLYCYLA